MESRASAFTSFSSASRKTIRAKPTGAMHSNKVHDDERTTTYPLPASQRVYIRGTARPSGACADAHAQMHGQFADACSARLAPGHHLACACASGFAEELPSHRGQDDHQILRTPLHGRNAW